MQREHCLFNQELRHSWTSSGTVQIEHRLFNQELSYKFEFPTLDDRSGQPIISFRHPCVYLLSRSPTLLKNLNFGTDIDSCIASMVYFHPLILPRLKILLSQGKYAVNPWFQNGGLCIHV